jgi:hypothetical protein
LKAELTQALIAVQVSYVVVASAVVVIFVVVVAAATVALTLGKGKYAEQ